MGSTRRTRWADGEGREGGGAGEIAWYVRAVQRRWILPVVGAALGGALFFGLASRKPLSYEGVSTLLVVPPAQPSAAAMNPATFRAIIESVASAAQVIKELGLDRPPHGLTPQAFVEDRLTVDEVRGTNVVRVKVALAEPRIAAEASSRLAQKAILLSREIQQQAGVSLKEQLKSHLDEASGRLQEAEQALLSYQQSAQVELVKEDATAMLKERGDLLRLVVDIEGERARLAAAELEMKRQQPLLSAPRTPAAEDALRTRPAPAGQVDPQQLDLTNPFVNPVYQTLDFQVAMSRTRIAALTRERDELINVKKLGGKELRQLTELYRRQIEQARLQASLDLARRVHDDLVIRYEQSRTLAVGNSAQLQLVDPAQPPERPASRKRLQNMALGSAIGFILAVFVAVLWEGRDRRLQSV